MGSTDNTQVPIAVVGMACRFPGSDSLDQYWRLLRDGVDAISEVPPERWSLADFYDPDSQAVGKANTRWGGFIEDVDRFDAAFFGISPREAIGVSPQQRLLLEVAWHAVENAGMAMPDLSARSRDGARTGVFLGIASFDYYDRVAQDPARMSGYSLTGNAYSVAANRLSYAFDLRGPSIALDTACSSSLVAIHLACQSLASGECSVALAGGAQVMLSPWVSVAAAKGEFLSPDGRCKTFDADANGYVRGEGIGIAVLKRLDEAERDGDPVWAVIRGSAVNQDGRSNGLTAPNPVAQVDVIETALRRAGIAPGAVGYVEAHGTGTALGDPMELQALARALAPRELPCKVGSVKSNFGHLEAAAGIAGFIKAVLCVHHAQIPPNLHYRRPNPLVDIQQLGLEVPTALCDWRGSGSRIAGVSSFGFGGTNAHALIEQAPVPDARRSLPRRPELFCLSARSRSALIGTVTEQADWFERHPQVTATAAAATLAHGRVRFNERATVVADSLSEAARQLRALPIENAPPKPASQSGRRGKPRVALLFTGQGAQYAGMGRTLLKRFAVYRDTWLEADRILVAAGHAAISDRVYGTEANDLALTATEYAQPALYVLQVGLWRVLQACGIGADIVLGHSAGEFAAAHCAGVLSFEDGLRLIARRAAAMQSCPGAGAMLSVSMDGASARALLARSGVAAVVAVVNSPHNVVLSGSQEDIAAIERKLSSDAIAMRRLEVSHAFHSVAMEPAAAELGLAAASTAHAAPRVSFLSSMTADWRADPEHWPHYWSEQLLRPVEFDQALSRLAQEQPDVVLELGPRAVLSTLYRTKTAMGVAALALIESNSTDESPLLRALGACFTAGADLRQDALSTGFDGPRPRLPGYAFDRHLHPLYPPVSTQTSTPHNEHAFLHGASVSERGAGHSVVTIPLGTQRFAYLGDHTVFGADVLPATGYIELAQAAVYRITGHKHWRLDELEFRRALVLAAEDRDVHVDLLAQGKDDWRFMVTVGDGFSGSERSADDVYSCGVLRKLRPPSAEAA